MKLTDGAGNEPMTTMAVERDGSHLVVKGRIFGTMPMTARISPEEARQGLKLLSGSLVWFLLTFLFRSSAPPPDKKT